MNLINNHIKNEIKKKNTEAKKLNGGHKILSFLFDSYDRRFPLMLSRSKDAVIAGLNTIYDIDNQ